MPIGKPIANTRVYVLDAARQPVPVGVVGELWVAGDGLARGYVNRPDLTNQRFVTAPFPEEPDGKLYRTGDMVRYRPDGQLEFIGRCDAQVKIRGYRVELSDIEATLVRHPRVREAAVVTRRGHDGEKSLVAYVVSDYPLDGRELREFCRNTLPSYMVPVAFLALDHLPLTANGKVDRRALPKAEMGVGSAASVTPRDELERRLAGIWQDVLAVNSLGIRDNFFDIGGHSLLAVRMFARIEQELGVILPLATLFQAPTVEELAAFIRADIHPRATRRLVTIQEGGSQPPLFAVPGVGGHVLGFGELARLLGPDQPVYALQSRGLDGLEAPLTRIEDIAAEFVQEIRALRPNGPYHLLGACMGGVVAYEMAQQLRAAGHEVGLLALLETWPPVTSTDRTLQLNAKARALLHLVGGRLGLYVRGFFRLRGRERLRSVRSRLRRFGQSLVKGDVFRGHRSEFNLLVVTKSNLLALQQYTARVYPGSAVLFRAEGRTVAATDDRRLLWRKLVAGGLHVFTVPGDDSGLMLAQPHVRILAQQLKAHIGQRASVLAWVATLLAIALP